MELACASNVPDGALSCSSLLPLVEYSPEWFGPLFLKWLKCAPQYNCLLHFDPSLKVVEAFEDRFVSQAAQSLFSLAGSFGTWLRFWRVLSSHCSLLVLSA